MHIVEKHYLGLELKSPERVPMLRKLATSVAGSWLDKIPDSDPAIQEEIVKGVWHSFVGLDIDNLLLTETAQEVVSNIKVGEAFDVEILRVLPPNQMVCYNFLLGPNRIIKCTWSNEYLIAIELTRHDDNAGVHCESAITSLESSINGFNSALVGAIQCLIFLKLTEPEIIHVAAGKKHGTRKQGHYNASAFPVTIVDSTWNKFIVRTEGFGVSGHFRMQRYGKGNADLKLVWIKPFLKHGYVRLPKSQALEEGNEPA